MLAFFGKATPMSPERCLGLRTNSCNRNKRLGLALWMEQTVALVVVLAGVPRESPP